MKIFNLYIISSLLLFCYPAFPAEEVFHDDELIKLNHWHYFTGIQTPDSKEWKKINLSSEIPELHDGKTIWLKTKLPEWKGSGAALYIGQVDYFLQVYLNKKLIYQFGDSSSLSNPKFIGLNQNLVELPYFQKGDILTINLNTEKASTGVLSNILLGTSGKITREVFVISFGSMFFSILFFAIGIIILINNFLIFKSNLLTGIASFIISIAVLYSANSLILQLIFKLPSLYYHMDYISLLSTTTSGFFAVEQLIDKKYQRILKLIWKFHLAVMVLCVLIINLTNIIFPDILPWFLIFLAISMITCFIAMVLSFKYSNKKSNLMFLGMAGFFFFAVLEIILFFTEGLYNNFGFSIRVLHFGVLCFVISLMWIVVQDYLNANKQKEIARQKELEAVTRENELRQQFTLNLLQSQENERNRIALELHDSVGQKLLLIKNQLLSRIRKEPDLASTEPLKKISNMTGETIQEIRNISWNLRPQHLDQLGLTTALETLVENVQQSTEIKIHFKADNIDDLIPKENEINFFRIVQESLNNIVKHSGGDDAYITIEQKDGMIITEIKDNGIGNKLMGNASINGMGLRGMYDRAEMIGAKLDINFMETGTTVSLEYCNTE